MNSWKCWMGFTVFLIIFIMGYYVSCIFIRITLCTVMLWSFGFWVMIRKSYGTDSLKIAWTLIIVIRSISWGWSHYVEGHYDIDLEVKKIFFMLLIRKLLEPNPTTWQEFWWWSAEKLINFILIVKDMAYVFQSNDEVTLTYKRETILTNFKVTKSKVRVTLWNNSILFDWLSGKVALQPFSSNASI